jgi:predicted AAA+ superfamily ATPase
LPTWRRAAFSQLRGWLLDPPAKRALLLAGARQVGKTTLLLQAIADLLASGIPPNQILYATFDHPFFKLVGIERVLKSWREYQPVAPGPEYLLLDEIQSVPDWQTWVKHQVDFRKDRRIAVTGSALPIGAVGQESGVGRWHTIKLPTLSFFEYLRIRGLEPPSLPEPESLAELFAWSTPRFVRTAEQAAPLVAHFHGYLLRGGFPQTARTESISTAQRLLREDIVDKVLKRDMTALFGVRRILELEKLFVYLCMHDGGQLDLGRLSTNLELNKQTVNNFIDLLEAANLIFKLRPYGYGKEVLRSRPKVYLADAAIAGSVLLRGEALLRDSWHLGAAVECAFFKHVFTHYYTSSVGFTYWRDRNDREVDIVAEVGGKLIPFEVKYSQGGITPADLKGLFRFVELHNVPRAYVITRDLSSFGPLAGESNDPSEPKRRIMRVPAPLACLWLSRLEHRPTGD